MSIHLRHYGNASGPVLLLLHGMPTSTNVLDVFGQHVQGRALVVVPELPGYGESPPLHPYSLSESHAAIEAAVHELAPGRPVHVLGYSGGGYRGFDLAVRGRLPVRSVVALSSVAGFPPPALEAFRQTAGAIRAGLDLAPIGTGMLTPRGQTDPVLRARVAEWMQACPADVLAEEFEACATLVDLHEAVAALDIDVLFRVGEHDANVPPPAVLASAARIPRAVAEVAAGQAHALPLEDVDATRASLERFWAGRFGAAA